MNTYEDLKNLPSEVLLKMKEDAIVLADTIKWILVDRFNIEARPAFDANGSDV